jgi:hypothetical protein
MSSKTASASRALATDTPAELVELHRLVESLPTAQRDLLTESLRKVLDASQRRRRILTLVQEALGQLRLDMKYLVFDLEATRRERDEYKLRLDGKSPEA